jgi:hypothetical protein
MHFSFKEEFEWLIQMREKWQNYLMSISPYTLEINISSKMPEANMDLSGRKTSLLFYGKNK